MQQLLLFSTHGAKASVLAQSVIRALPLRAVGFRMLPYALAGQTRGELLHFLGAQDPMENDVPCTLRLGRQRTVSIPEVWEELAAPTLRPAPEVEQALCRAARSGVRVRIGGGPGLPRLCPDPVGLLPGGKPRAGPGR